MSQQVQAQVQAQATKVEVGTGSALTKPTVKFFGATGVLNAFKSFMVPKQGEQGKPVQLGIGLDKKQVASKLGELLGRFSVTDLKQALSDGKAQEAMKRIRHEGVSIEEVLRSKDYDDRTKLAVFAHYVSRHMMKSEVLNDEQHLERGYNYLKEVAAAFASDSAFTRHLAKIDDPAVARRFEAMYDVLHRAAEKLGYSGKDGLLRMYVDAVKKPAVRDDIVHTINTLKNSEEYSDVLKGVSAHDIFSLGAARLLGDMGFKERAAFMLKNDPHGVLGHAAQHIGVTGAQVLHHMTFAMVEPIFRALGMTSLHAGLQELGMRGLQVMQSGAQTMANNSVSAKLAQLARSQPDLSAAAAEVQTS